MIGAMWNGIAGIWQHDKGIAVESNNLANSNTVGHKKDQISFSDLLYSQGGFGKGVQTDSISKQFGQGNIVQSGVGIDVAIEGKGFFVVKSRENPNEIYYTRAGNLVQAKDGFLDIIIDVFQVINIATYLLFLKGLRCTEYNILRSFNHF